MSLSLRLNFIQPFFYLNKHKTQRDMALIDDFNLAVSKSKDLTKRPSNEELLELYGLFKQATEGDVNEPKPMGFDFKAIAKYSAWESKKGIEKDKAMQDYINLMKTLQEHYS